MPSLRRSFPPLLLALLSPYLAAQTPPPAPQSVDLRYTGASARVGIGYDTENNLRGDAYWVFREDARSAWIGEAWAASSSAGGLKVSYDWLPEGAEPATGVRKLFAAVDQNRWRDRKVTLGGGYETERWFASGYVAAGVTGRRQTSYEQATTTQTVLGADDGRPYAQDIFTTTTTQQYQRAYDGGVGGHAGHFYEPALLRLDAGVDYEWGRGSTSQSTLSLGIEKFFSGSPISVALVGQAYWKRGDFESGGSDQRLVAMVRYDFGGPAWRPAKEYRKVQVEVPAPAPVAVAAAPVAAPPAAPRVEKRMVKTTATAASDAFFDLDAAMLRPAATSALDAAIARLKANGYEGNIRVSGHTCDLGSDAHNQRLSEQRAAAVRAYLVANGIAADRIVAEGMGKRAPRFPNDAESRPKNRRVDIEFVTYEQRIEEVALPPLPATAAPAPVAVAPAAPGTRLEWRDEEIATEPAWLRRALHNTAQHKQNVDTYTTQAVSTTTVAGEKRYLNRAPVAAPDSYTVDAGAATALDVLGNDRDPDGDPLAISAVTAPAHGTALISGTKIVYTPAPGYAGPDAFTYTIADGKGLNSSAKVTLTVVAVNRSPVARDDYAQAGFNQPVTIDVLANDLDPDGDKLAVASFTQPENGTVTRGPGQTLVYAAKLNWIGYDKFSYTVSDGRGGTATAQVVVYADP